MPRKGGRITPQERAFIEAQVAHGDPRVAARVAGYKHPEANGYGVAARPAIAAEIARRQLERLQTEILPLAVDALQDLLTNKAVPHGARVQAVKVALDRTLGDQDKLGDKEAHEMTLAEINERLAQLKRHQGRLEAADAIAVTIEAEPVEGDVFG